MKHPLRFLFTTIGLAGALVLPLQAAEVPLEDAETAVANWIRLGRDPTGRRAAVVESSRTVVDEETGAAVHVVRLEGGGFVVTAADDGLSPIMASSASGDLEADERNPLWALWRRDAAWAKATAAPAKRHPPTRRDTGGGAAGPDIGEVVAEGAEANRAAWDELLGRGGTGGVRAKGARKDASDWASDVQVGVPLTESAWSQETDTGWSLQDGGQLCYNYYTPPLSSASGAGGRAKSGSLATPVADSTNSMGRWPCGCTATAGAQLMFFHKTPASFVHAADFPDQTLPVDFLWPKMKTRPRSASAREAVGKLTGTVAYKIKTSFTVDGHGRPVGSASVANLKPMLTGTAPDGTAGFGWKSARHWAPGSTIPLETLQQALIPNLDGGFPCIMGIDGTPGGHAIVVDGYRFSGGEFHVHANFGWLGQDSAWYAPPTFRTSQGTFTTVDELLYNVFPENQGSLVSVRVVNAQKKKVRGYRLTYSASGNLTVRKPMKCAAGTSVFFAPTGTYSFTATCGGLTATGTATVAGGSGVNNRILPLILKVGQTGKVTVGTKKARRGAGGAKDGAAVAYTDPLEVTLASETEGASIWYTLDGSEPDFGEREDAEGTIAPLNPNCRRYEGPFTIAGGDATLRAVATMDGMADSDETTVSFAFQETKSRDLFADARELEGPCGTATFDNAGCGAEAGEPAHSAKGNPEPASVWGTWTAPHDGTFTFRLSGAYADDGTAMDTQLAVYTGSSVSGLARVAWNDDVAAQDWDFSSCATFDATSGSVYRIAMDSHYGGIYPGTLTLEWSEGGTDFVSLDASSHSVSGSGERRTVALETSSGWTLEDYSDWLEPLAESGSDAEPFAYEAPANTTGKVRTGRLLFRSGEDGWATLTVTQGTLPWATTKAEATAAAQASGKRILLVSGRDTCSNTRYTRFTACEDETVHDLLRDGYVLWYNDCDNLGSETWAYASGLGSYTLPLVCVLEPDASTNWLSRTTGLRTAAQLREALDDVVLFDAGDGTAAEPARYLAPGSAYGTLPTATKEGHSLVGWFAEETGGTAAKATDTIPAGVSTLHARWAAQSYRVALDRRGGTGGSTNATATYGQNMPAISVPTRTGYDFGGYWSQTNGAGVQYYTAAGTSARTWDVAANAILYASWAGKKSVVTFEFEGGAGGTASATAEYGSAMPAVVPPRREGWTFLGYWTEQGGNGTQYYDGAGAGVRLWDRTAATTLFGHWSEAAPSPVFRFYSKNYKGHFFTIDEEEMQTVRDTNPNWKYEGVAYQAFTNAANGTVALYRFYSKSYRGHFFTIDEEEMQTVRDTNPNWKYEGIAYYVYPEEMPGTVPVYRFWSKGYKHHFYTIDEAEKDTLIATNPNWKYETVAFWAIPAEVAGAAKATKAMKAMKAIGLEQLEALEQLEGEEAGAGEGEDAASRAWCLRDGRGVVVTTCDGTDGSAAADGDEGTGWSPAEAGAGWVVLSFEEPVEVGGVEVVGEGLPEGWKALLSADAEEWGEEMPYWARYVWVSWPEGAPVVREVRVAP